jgi:Flp pilus assembly protein TadG
MRRAARHTPGRHGRGDAGSAMAVEVVLMTPVMVAFLLLVVAFGRYVAVRGEVEAASRDAVRAASLERSLFAAEASATRTARASLAGEARCTPAQITGDFARGETIGARLTCRVPLNDLGLLGLPGSVSVRAESLAPLDLYRRSA